MFKPLNLAVSTFSVKSYYKLSCELSVSLQSWRPNVLVSWLTSCGHYWLIVITLVTQVNSAWPPLRGRHNDYQSQGGDPLRQVLFMCVWQMKLCYLLANMGHIWAFAIQINTLLYFTNDYTTKMKTIVVIIILVTIYNNINKTTFKQTWSLSNDTRFRHENNVCTYRVSALILYLVAHLSPEINSATLNSCMTGKF